MSLVTNCIFSFSIGEDEEAIMKEVNSYFEIKERPLISVEDKLLPHGWYGGSKYLETPIYIGAFNFFSIEHFMSHIKELPWKEPENVQLIAQGQEEDYFTIYILLSEEHP